MSPYLIVYGKPCHLLVELEHKAWWAINQCNMKIDEASNERKLQFRNDAYENARIYKEKAKTFHN